ncbi:MAG: glycosyltransferase [Leadbetterella sp.]
MKILHILTYSWENGGSSKVVYDMALYQQRAGHEVVILDLELSNHSPYKSINGVIVKAVKLGWLNKLIPLFSNSVDQEIRDSSYDLIQLHGLWNYTLLSAHLAGVHNKCFLTVHGCAHPYTFLGNELKRGVFSALFQKNFLKKIHTIHVLHEDEKKDMISYLGQDSGNFYVLPNGIDAELPYKPSEAEGIEIQKQFDFLKSKQPYLLFLSRLHQKKGLDILMPAFLEVYRTFTEHRLVIAGPDFGMLNYINQFIQENSLQEVVFYIGSVEKENKHVLISNAEAFVFPTHSEGFSMAVLEMLSAGIPVVSTTETGLSKEIVNYQAGLISDVNKEEFTKNLLDFLKLNSNQKIAMGHKGKKLIAEKYEIGLVMKDFITYIEKQFRS